MDLKGNTETALWKEAAKDAAREIRKWAKANAATLTK